MAERRAMCTIIAKNYVAAARTLCQSFMAQHPQGECYVLIIDEIDGVINPADEPYEICSLDILNIPNLKQFCFKYDLTELSTAVKPYFMEHLLQEKALDHLLYLDPDILVTSPLSPLYEKLNTYDIVLTPHLDTDYPDDGLLPDDGHILKSGLYNLGFLGVSARPNALVFLRWWQAKLYELCIIDFERGYFVDQKFVDLVPILFQNIYIEQDVGYNVAYWNLHSRHLAEKNGIWKCNDSDLKFFHFSSYHPEREGEISSHATRYRLEQRPDLVAIFSDYTDRMDRNGYQETRHWPYTFASFDDGELIPRQLRLMYYHQGAGRTQYGMDPFASKKLKTHALLMRLKCHDIATKMTLRMKSVQSLLHPEKRAL